MRHGLPGSTFATAVFFGLALIAASPASAKCTRLAFSVNDYGKPIEDAKNLLDKYIATEMSKKGIAKYRTGKKDVTCDFFITLLVVDEYTCKAEADVCWDEAAPGAAAIQAQAPGAPASAPATGAKKPPAVAKAGALAAPKAVAKSAARPVPAAAPAASSAVVTPVETVEPPETAAAPDETAPLDSSPQAPAQDDAEAPSQPAGVAGEDGPPPDAAAAGATDPSATETGAIEKYAAPKKIVIPEPIQVKRGVPVDPGAADAGPARGPAAAQ